ncbi:hypothetical protein JR316_0000175 [Psilocybe cubensis]|uniref:Uncharacterized protein n=2 Tax=Psilocybe cubensis TaxID=181762 RepID=A0ACB8HDV2_PSICU|nr:hypothetical protein JR316_0000175 [Psilocybe cubensis]KAH9486111.1 hypothetical protein JR316_0000175 [Psilocybe cubensis]
MKLTAKTLLKHRAQQEAENESPKRLRPTAPHLTEYTCQNSTSITHTTILADNGHIPSLQSKEKVEAKLPPSVSEPPAKPSELTEELQAFQDNKDELLDYLFEREHHPLIGTPCQCGQGTRLVCCTECLGHNATCRLCFIAAHLSMPCHWALVWQEGEHGGFFVKRDISQLIPGGNFAIPLGHGGLRCPGPETEEENVFFQIIDHNGVHDTRVHFCTCLGRPNRVRQLIQFGFFPATLKQPKMAFTLTVLKQFHLHHLESKESAYDFIGALRRLTDNMFAASTTNPYPQFLRVMRFWRVLIATKRLGQAHGIDQLLPHRPPGNLLVFCPACPEAGLNMEKNWDQTPKEFSHLNQMQLTLDGNFHANRYNKNSSDDDYSLYEGRAYYPTDSDFKSYLRSLPAQDIADKIDCPIKAVKNRNLVMENLSETGIINVQCPHVIVVSTVDLQRGERFANTDYAVALALRRIRDTGKNNSDQYLTWLAAWISYDMVCSYWVNIVSRFKVYFPDLVEIVKRLSFLIPLVHVHNHKENCEYLYSSAYQSGAGHFHGETAEHEWVELNQLAPQVRQMNNGHRQDTLIDHHGDWNFKKMANMASSLETDIVHSRKIFHKKRDDFIAKTALYSDRAPLWNCLDRELRTVSADKEIQCVFRHKTGKVPSQAKIYEGLVDRLKKLADKSDNTFLNMESSVRLINEGIIIERKQQELASKLASEEYPMAPKEMLSRRTKLAKLIKGWKTLQQDVMGTALCSVETSSIDKPECTKLYLPSSFSATDRAKYDLEGLAADELLLRKGNIFDTIRNIQDTSKTLSSMRTERQQNDRGQTARTRSKSKLEDVERLLSLQIHIYNLCRQALVSLGGDEYSSMFPEMTVADTYWVPTHLRREIGTSRKSDGRIFNPGITGGAQGRAPGVSNYLESTMDVIQTQGSKPKPRNDKKLGKDKKGTNRGSGISPPKNDEKVKKDGWIWSLAELVNLTPEDIEAWSDESDRVKWFRAEAEMRRWQEENEINQAQFLRCIRSFHVMSKHWTQLAKMNATDPGRVAYAKKMSARFSRLESDAKERLVRAGYRELVDNYTGENAPLLSEHMAANRTAMYAPISDLLVSFSTTPSSLNPSQV